MFGETANQIGRPLSASTAFIYIFTASITRDRAERWVTLPPSLKARRPRSKPFRPPGKRFKNQRRENRGPFRCFRCGVGACRRVIARGRCRGVTHGDRLRVGGGRVVRKRGPQNLSGEVPAALRSVDCPSTRPRLA